MDELALLTDLHAGNTRQGPGGDDETRFAIALAGLVAQTGLRIADIGCGTGASALILAQDLDADVTAVDALPGFLAALEGRAARAGLSGRITTLAASMDDLPFAADSLDAIWSEGAIYNMGFENGIRAWRRFLKPGGVLAVSELTWFTADRPAEIEAYWSREYPEVGRAGAKIALLEKHGYTPIGYHALPEACWRENYFRPLAQGFEAFLDRHGADAGAQDVIRAQREEIALHDRYARYFGYGFYIARKTAA
ncbi:MAG: Methyltransferase domain [Saliniramus fredricksonii]|uniref:Methyltransferase domain n=1 Tax=Saliniramus fredricksonii TaxID=1653334 RepID=A0A0P8A8B2_9HYPH|nr:class I SAM-dependent methyltransferase [Saliniramus fredricksonii]KPQ11383.1 MAG: Methyltransferase domain [Saliniramus fredricksonii]SCC81967.1 Methyltransferase domain-containing protein [Saliniramus fredricksonii]